MSQQPPARDEDVARALDDLQDAIQHPERQPSGLVRPHQVTLTEEDLERNRPRRRWFSRPIAWRTLSGPQRAKYVLDSILSAVVLLIGSGLAAFYFWTYLQARWLSIVIWIALCCVLWLARRAYIASAARRGAGVGTDNGDLSR